MARQHKLSFGMELEWSDIDRRVDIPESLGSWEGPKIAGYYMGSELDIVNTKGRNKGQATDPLCILCQVGGEIHTVPSETIDTQMMRVMQIMNLFDVVNVACPNHGHIHVGIPGIKNDLEGLKNMFEWLYENQHKLLDAITGTNSLEVALIKESNIPSWVKSYLVVGDAKSIPAEDFEKIREAQSVQEILQILKDQEYVLDEEPFSHEYRNVYGSHRTVLNMFNLTKGETVEFRGFRASINPVEIYSCLYFAKRAVEEALKGKDGLSVDEILKEGIFRFPQMNFDEKLAQGWADSRLDKGRCGPFKKYTGYCEVSEDPIFTKETPRTAEEEGMLAILDLCKLDFEGRTI